MGAIKQESKLGAEIQAQFAANGDPAYLVAWRGEAAERYEDLPMPKYERSDIGKRKLDAFRAQGPERPGDMWESLAQPYLSPQGPLLVVADGAVVMARGLDAFRDQGVVFSELREAARAHPEIVKTWLGEVVGSGEDKLLALQAGLWRSGAFVYVPKGVVVDVPLQFVSVTTAGGYGTFVRHLIVVEELGEVTFTDAYTGDRELADELCVSVTEVIAQDGARVRIGTVHDLPRKATHVAARRAKVDRNADVQWVLGEIGDSYTVGEFGSVLEGDGSRSTGHTVALGSGRARMDLTARMIHKGRFSESDTIARGVMQGRATAVYRGVTQILKGAGGANGQQAERLLMLSPESRADAIPMLLIDENDVKCGHAASVGQISEDQLFYLMSRGVSEVDAKRMIVRGFLEPIVSELPIEAVRKAVEAVIERKMA